MKEYKREYPIYSLCGLNCGLCPRYNTNGVSRCPGCGGVDFHLKHPTCAVITCNKKHDNIEFCFQCSDYPCDKYSILSSKDSFISYKNVITDFQKVENSGLDTYLRELKEKMNFLEDLLDQYNDGRRKKFYCNVLNQINIEDIREIMNYISADESLKNVVKKEKIEAIVSIFKEKALERNIDLYLRI